MNRLESLDQSHKIHAAVTVLPDVHPCQHDFTISPRGKNRGLLDHIIRKTTPFMPSCEWNQTEAAHDVTAVLNFEQRSRGVWFAVLGQGEVLSIDRLAMEYLRLLVLFQRMGGRKKRRQIPLELISDNEIDAGDGAQLLDASLRITTGDGHKGFWRVPQGLSNHIATSPFRVFRHRAGIHDEQIRRFPEFDDVIPVSPKARLQNSRLGLVEATAECMEGGSFHSMI